MTLTDWTLFILAAAGSLGGLAALYLAWKRRNQPLLLLAGWSAFLIAATLAVIANGDRGLAQVCVIAMSVVSVFLLAPVGKGLTSVHAPMRNIRSPSQESQKTGLLRLAENIWTFMVSGLLSGLIAVYTGAALFRVIRPETGNPATAGVIAIITSVLLWALFSMLLLIEARPVRRTAYAVAGLLTSVTLAYL